LIQQLKPLLRALPKTYQDAIPFMGAIPTTAGTGSEGGKSAVILDPSGNKFIFGHPIFFPRIVGLIPNFTYSLPPELTAATGVDALFHLLEALFVTHADGINDGLNEVEIARCDNWALLGTEIIAQFLPQCLATPHLYQARFYMQFASLFGAKAFRKGDLGAVHATAHSIGALYHLHHGTAIARMSVPVLEFNESKANPDLKDKFDRIRQIFNKAGVEGDSLSKVIKEFLKRVKLPLGLSGIDVQPGHIEKLVQLAVNDGCQTNPIRLAAADYKVIFTNATKC